MGRGLLIVLEGLDSSGKKTQTKLLKKRLKEKELDVETVSFPVYETKIGKIVASYLRGELFKKKIIPEAAAMLFALNRYEFKDEVSKKLEKGKIILSDRYTPSTMAFHGAMIGEKDRVDFMNWVESIESRLPQPDLVLFLDMPVEAAQSLMKKRKPKKYLKGKKKDIYEKEISFQKKVREIYLQLASEREKWIIIVCANKVKDEWKIKKPEDINEEITQIVKETFLL